MFWNKEDEEIKRLRTLLVENTARSNENTKRMESYVDLILDHLKLKYVPETETKEPAKLVEKNRLTDVTMSSLMGSLNNYPIYVTDLPVFNKPKKKPFYKPNFNNMMNGYGLEIAEQPKKRGRPKKK